MMKRMLGAGLLAAMVLGAIALVAPVPTAQARECVICPQIGILCGDCYTLIPQNCHRCAYCKRIPGCKP